MPDELTEEIRTKIVEMRKSGATYTQIRKALGISDPSISKALKRAGLTQGGKKPLVPRSKSGGVAAATTPAAPPAPPPAASSTAANGLAELMPPAPAPKPAARVGHCSACGARVRIDADEKDPVCPGCGEPLE